MFSTTMTRSLTLNSEMYNLLIDRGMDQFTVLQARDALLIHSKRFTDGNEARKFVYRQLLAFERKGWLVSSGEDRDKTYAVTEIFKQLSFVPKGSSVPKVSPAVEVDSLSLLEKEKQSNEAELAITLGEVEAYQRLLKRFPDKEAITRSLLDNARERSARQLGQIKALGELINACTTLAL